MVVPAIYQMFTDKQDDAGGLREGYEYFRLFNFIRTALDECITELGGVAQRELACVARLVAKGTIMR